MNRYDRIYPNTVPLRKDVLQEMDIKRNLRYFTAPVVSAYTIIGLIVAVIGFIGCKLFMSEIQWVALLLLLVGIAGIIIIVIGAGKKSKPADIDFQIYEKTKYLEETAQKRHEVYESHFSRIIRPVKLKGYDYLTKEGLLFRRGSDNKNRTNLYNAAILYFTKDTMYIYGKHFSLTDDLFDKEIVGKYKFTELDHAEIVDDTFTYVRNEKYTYRVNVHSFRIVKNDGSDAIMMSVDYGADMDTACEQLNHVIKLAKEQAAQA